MERQSLARLAALAATQLETASHTNTDLSALPQLASEIRCRLGHRYQVPDITTILGMTKFFKMDDASTYRELETETRSLVLEIEEIAVSPCEHPRVAHLQNLCRRLTSVVSAYEKAA